MLANAKTPKFSGPKWRVTTAPPMIPVTSRKILGATCKRNDLSPSLLLAASTFFQATENSRIRKVLFSLFLKVSSDFYFSRLDCFSYKNIQNYLQ
jgi:hypothetical protein